MRTNRSILLLSGVVFRSLAVTLLAGGLTGCASPSVRVRVVTPAEAASAELPTIALYGSKDELSRSYREMAYLSFDGAPGEFPEAVRQFQDKARRMGADAIILVDGQPFEGFRVPFNEEMRYGATAIKYLE